MIRSVPMNVLWVAMTNFAAQTAHGLKSDAIRIKATGDGVVIVNPDDAPSDFVLYFVPAAQFSRIFPPGMGKTTHEAVDRIIEDAIEASTEKVIVPGALTAYIDSVDRALVAMLPAMLGGMDGSPPASKGPRPSNPGRFPPGMFN